MNVPVFSRKKILIVDDDDAMCDYIKRLLEAEGFVTISAVSGEEALRLTETQDPDLILMDVDMPVMNGFEAIRKIRSDKKNRLTPIILVTALKGTADRIKGIEAGCDNFISKPFDENELLAGIKSLLTISYYRMLLDEKEKFEYVLNHMNSGIIVLDPMNRISQINKKTQELLQIGPLQGEPFDFFKLIYGQFQVRYEGDLPSDVKSKAVTFELERPGTENFKQLILSVMSSSIRNPAGELNSIVMVILDVTDQRKNEFLKFTFIDLVSQKLLTPLTSIGTGLALIQDGHETAELIDLCLSQFNELQYRVKNILYFCEVLRENPILPVEKIILSDYLSELARSFLQTKNGRKIEYETVCNDSNLYLNIEKKYFDLIMGNLVDNAVEHNDQENIKIRIKAGRLGEKVEISVADNGRGIPPEEFDRIFDDFYQIDKWLTGNMKGVGLGLAMVKHLVARHGGEIRVDSKIKKGTTFILTLGINPNSPGGSAGR